MNDTIEVQGTQLEQHPTLGFIPLGTKATTEYCLEYMHNGTKWCLNFFAEDEEDAAKKVLSLRESLVLLGRLECSIPWSPEKPNVELTGAAPVGEASSPTGRG